MDTLGTQLSKSCPKRRVAAALLAVLVVACTAAIPDPRIPAPPPKEAEPQELSPDLKDGQELSSQQRAKMPDLNGETPPAPLTAWKYVSLVSLLPATKAGF